MKNHCTYWFKGFWNWCCKFHDKCYELAEETRLQCDNTFFKCIVNKNKWLGWAIAPFMWTAVRIGGSTHYKENKMKKLMKSSTFLNGAIGVVSLGAININQDSIADIINGIAILTGNGSIATTVITIVTGLLTLFGIGKGRLDAEIKPPLDKR